MNISDESEFYIYLGLKDNIHYFKHLLEHNVTHTILEQMTGDIFNLMMNARKISKGEHVVTLNFTGKYNVIIPIIAMHHLYQCEKMGIINVIDSSRILEENKYEGFNNVLMIEAVLDNLNPKVYKSYDISIMESNKILESINLSFELFDIINIEPIIYIMTTKSWQS